MRGRTIYFWLLIAAACLGQACTDHKTTIPFDFPEYAPQLVVQSAVGPAAGAEATIAWSRPLEGQPGVVPDFPELSVFLLEGGERVYTFVESADSKGYFTVSPDLLDLQENVAYTLEVFFEDTGESLFSERAFLPPPPVIEEAEASVYHDEWGSRSYDLLVEQASAGEGIGAVSMLARLLDDDGNPIGESGWNAYFGAEEFRYVDKGRLPERTIQKRYGRWIGGSQEEPEYAHAVDVRLAYLSPELVQFKRDVDKLGYFGESYFQTTRPIYSNINGAVGIFGLYNEASVVLPITDEEDTP